MLDNFQFTLLIVVVGLGAYLVSMNQWHGNQIDILSRQVIVHQSAPLIDGHEKEKGRVSASREMASKNAMVEKVTYLKNRERQLAISVFLLISFIALLAIRIFLWACPDPLKAYRHEGSHDTEEREKSGIRQKIKPRRSIFAHLVAGAVGWPQVLKVLRKRQRQESDQKEQAKKEQQAKEDFQRGGFRKLGLPRL